MLAEGNPILEKELRKMDIFSFLNRILALMKNQKTDSKFEDQPFGAK